MGVSVGMCAHMCLSWVIMCALVGCVHVYHERVLGHVNVCACGYEVCVISGYGRVSGYMWTCVHHVCTWVDGYMWTHMCTE